MPTVTYNVSFNEDLADFLDAEVAHGAFSTASEAVRHAVREWRDRKIAEDVAALAAAHAGAHERDTTEEELGEILAAQKSARAKILGARSKPAVRARGLPARKAEAVAATGKDAGR